MAQSSDNSLKSMGPIMFGGKDKVLEWFQGKGIVPAIKLCERCPNSQQIVLTVKSDVADGYKFQCPACKTFKSVRGGRSQTGQQSSGFLEWWIHQLLHPLAIWKWFLTAPHRLCSPSSATMSTREQRFGVISGGHIANFPPFLAYRVIRL